MHLRYLSAFVLATAAIMATTPAWAQDAPVEVPVEPLPTDSERSVDRPTDVEPDDRDRPDATQDGAGRDQGDPARGGADDPQPPADDDVSTADGDSESGTDAETGTENETETAESKVPIDEIRRYVSVYNAVKHAYVKPVDDEELMQSAIRGLLLDLDPHSMYLEAEAAENFEEQARGAYDGIGVELLRQPDGSMRVIAPIDDTPAARAGIRAGDVIIAIDGQRLSAGDDPADATMRGQPGTEVTLTIVREDRDEPFDVTLVRETIDIASVRGHMLEPGYGYIRISAFQVDTAADFQARVEELEAQAGGRLKGLVIDLRSNPGGLLTSSVQIADALLEDGEIVSTRGRIAISDTQFSATPGDLLDGAPVVLLVDVGSASASEVLAGALRDNDRALVVGSRTFGKGSVQTVLPLDNGDSVKLTTALYYTPSGASIQAVGIVPDVVLHPAEDAENGGRAEYTEATLPGHLSATGEAATADAAGEVLEGDHFIDAALVELKEQVGEAPSADTTD